MPGRGTASLEILSPAAAAQCFQNGFSPHCPQRKEPGQCSPHYIGRKLEKKEFRRKSHLPDFLICRNQPLLKIPLSFRHVRNP